MVNGVLQGRGHEDEAEAYLHHLAMPEPPHFSIEFGEDFSVYMSRISGFENLYYDILSEQLPVQDKTDEGRSMVYL